MKKKVLTLLMAVTMAMAVPMTAFADAPAQTTGTETQVTHTYGLYEIFSGDIESGKLTNADWSSNVGADAKTAIYDHFSLTGDNQTAAKVMELLGNMSNGTGYDATDATGSDANKFAAVVAAQIKKGNITRSGDSNAASEDGYYAVYDETEGATLGTETADFTSLQLIEEGKGMTAITKHTSTTSEKKVKDTNDSSNDTSDWQDDADYDIGDEVTFQLTGTVADDYDNYDTYQFIFHDIDKEGLEFNEITSVTVDGTTLTNEYKVVTENLNDDCSFHVIIGKETTKENSGGTTSTIYDLKTMTEAAVKAGSEIVVTYTSTLTEDAVIGSDGNPNKMRVEFSNNPNNDQTGYTVWDGVIVFTYQTTVNKFDQDGNALEGAAFALYKYDMTALDGVTDAGDAADVVGTGTAPDYVTYNDRYYHKVNAIDVKDGQTSFSFTGIDDGDYLLIETTVPEGYNKADPTAFSVIATHSNAQNSADGGTLVSLNGELTTGMIDITATDATEGGTDAPANNITNKAGALLPSTGGIGTTIFYVVGGLLIVGAGVLLFVKTRTKKND